jgi:hypothetical protein
VADAGQDWPLTVIEDDGGANVVGQIAEQWVGATVVVLAQPSDAACKYVEEGGGRCLGNTLVIARDKDVTGR